MIQDLLGPGDRLARRRKRQARRRMRKTEKLSKKQCEANSKGPGCQRGKSKNYYGRRR